MSFDFRAAWKATRHQLTETSYDGSETAELWLDLVDFLQPMQLLKTPLERSKNHAQLAFSGQALEQAGLKDKFIEQYLPRVRDAFGVVQPQIIAYLDQFEAAQFDHEQKQQLIFTDLLNKIGEWMHVWRQPLSSLWPPWSIEAVYKPYFMQCLYTVLPPNFASALSTYLGHLLLQPTPLSSISAQYPHTATALFSLLERYDPLLFGLIYHEIEQKVIRECRRQFSEPKLQSLLDWVNGPVLLWVAAFYEVGVNGGIEEAKKLLKPTFTRFEYHIHKNLCLLRASEMFDIIVEYPRSTPALDDLKVCLYKTDQRTTVVNKLRVLNNQRLLHPGIDTKDIINQYIATIRCLRLLDPQGVLLSRVADPIRQYLRAREDTIRCIVSSLIEEGNELVKELAASDAKPVQDAKDEAENYNDPKWVPDPIDAPPDFRKSRGSDIIQLLVSIYDTKDVFVKELQVLLAQRLLAVKDYAFEKEIKNVEVLKVRFGEASLQGCEVMIKDLHDSRKIDVAVHERNQGVPLHATIVSRLFWPSFQPAPLKLPGQLGRAQYEYDQAFVGLKPDKKLRWLPQLGSLNITIELRDRTLTLDATPLQASVLEVFNLNPRWTADTIGDELRIIDTVSIRNALYFWNNLGVLKSLPDDEWQLLEVKDAATEKAASHVIEEEAQAVQSVEAQQIEQMRVYWQYIQGMLTNLGTLPIARIHSTLNMLVPTYKGKTTDELVAFLDAMKVEGLVEKTSNGSWKIVK